MADTYTVAALGVTFAQNKCMLGVFNGSGSGKVIRVYRMWMLNNGVTAVTGVLTTMEIRRTTTGSGGTAITPLAHDTTNASIPAQVVCATNQSVTVTDLFRRFIWSNDEAAANATANIDELETLIPFCNVWDTGYTDANIEPITLREGEGVALVNIGNTSVGTADIFFEITQAAS